MTTQNDLDDLIFAGLTGYAVAIDRRTGEELWRTNLKSSGYGLVTLLLDGDILLAGATGRIYALDPSSGEVLWTNELKKLGYSSVSLATRRGSSDDGGFLRVAAQQQQDGS